MTEEARSELTSLTVDVVSAFVSNNRIDGKEVPDLITKTYAALAALDAPPAAAPDIPAFTPAVSVRKSLRSRDHIISMIDGKPYRTLKRHLTARGLTPETYRERYNLPAGYPMVAPGYSDHRREVAKRLGLGRRPQSTKPPAPAPRARGVRRKGA